MDNHRPTICQVLHSLHLGGAEVLVAGLVRRLSPAYRFVFACLDELGTLGQGLQQEGFPLHVLERKPGFDWRCAWKLADFLRKERVNLIHAHQYTAFFYSQLARMIYRQPAILFTEHGRHFPDYPRKKRRLFNRLMLRPQDRVVSDGAAIRQALIDNEGLSSRRVKVLYIGIDLEPFANGIPSRPAIRKEWQIGPDDLVLVQVARLDYLKDHSTALATFAQVLAQRPDAWLLLIGEGPEKEKIRKLVQEQDFQGRVRVLGRQKDIVPLLFAADFFLLTSISEGIPLVLMEAMAAGLPVVATNVGGVAEVVDDGRTGLLAPARDAGGLAANILHLAENSALCRQMSSQGRERVRQLFSEEKMHAQYSKLYQDMLAN